MWCEMIPYRQDSYEQVKKLNSALILIATLILAGLLCLASSCDMLPIPAAHAEEISYSDEQIAQAIKKTENSRKYPYGVKSINTRGDERLAHNICLNSIRNAKKRYFKAGMPGDFIAFMGLRYSPPNINPNWVRLVHHFLEVK